MSSWVEILQSLEVLAVDDYVNQVYTSSQQPPVMLYLGITKAKALVKPFTPRKTVCLDQVGSRLCYVERPNGQHVHVNSYVIEKGLMCVIVLYWYQSQGRVIATNPGKKCTW